MLIPRLVHSDDEPTRAEGKPGWFPTRMRGEDGEYHWTKPTIRCNCGHLTGIGLHHVHADGTVTASFYHAKEWDHPDGRHISDPTACEWHVHIKLADYDCGDFPPGVQ